MRWSTLDGSPQFGYDWILHGHMDMNTMDLVETFEDALRYIALCQARGEEDSENAGALKELAEKLTQRLAWRMGLPAAVGAGRASMAHKLHCLAHSERMTTTSWAKAVDLVNSTFSYTGDMGTEIHISNCRVTLNNLMGWAQDGTDSPHFHFDFESKGPHFHFDFEDDDSNAGDGSGAGPMFDFQHDDLPVPELPPPAAVANGAQVTVDTTHSIYIPGLLHIIHNRMKYLSAVLSSQWPTFVNQLRHVCRLLSRRRSHGRLMET